MKFAPQISENCEFVPVIFFNLHKCNLLHFIFMSFCWHPKCTWHSPTDDIFNIWHLSFSCMFQRLVEVKANNNENSYIRIYIKMLSRLLAIENWDNEIEKDEFLQHLFAHVWCQKLFRNIEATSDWSAHISWSKFVCGVDRVSSSTQEFEVEPVKLFWNSCGKTKIAQYKLR